MAVSETASFKRIDLELESIAKRFPDSRIPQNRDHSVTSRFREEFDQPVTTKSRKKPSIFVRLLHRMAAGETRSTLVKQEEKRCDGRKDVLAGTAHSRRPTKTEPDAGLMTQDYPTASVASEKPAVLQSATDVWQRAVRLEAERREALGHDQLSSRQIQRHAKHESRSGDSSAKAYGRHSSSRDRDASSIYSRSLRESRSGAQSPKSRSVDPSGGAGVATGTLPNTSNRILKEWKHQVQSEESGSHEGPSFTTCIYSTRKSNITPASWARWPSHTRAERTGAAGTRDSVKPKDFAATGTTPGGDTKWSTDKNTSVIQANKNPSIQLRSSLSSKFGSSIKSGLAKILPSRDDSAHWGETIEDYKKRPGENGYLEFPELELLPHLGGYKELEALEQQIDKIKNPSNSLVGSRSRGLSGDSSKMPLSMRLAQEVQMIQHTHTDKGASPDLAKLLSSTPSLLPDTPAGRRSTSQAKSGTSQQYGTPLTHVSYEDCVPTHMLDEIDSSKSDATVMVKRSKSHTETSMPTISSKFGSWNGRARSNSASVKRASEHASDLERNITGEGGHLRVNKDKLGVGVK